MEKYFTDLTRKLEETSKAVSNLSKQVGEKAEGVRNQFSYDKDKYKGLMRMVKDYGYPIEKHFYSTDDDYINCLFRINGGRGTQAKDNNIEAIKKPVLLYQHGLMDSAAGICCNGTNSLAFFLADCGFDVWLNNSRGNCYSRQHKYFDADVDKEYWDFSFHELGKFDQPAVFNYILNQTDMPNLTYIGHSQGTTQMFAALSLNPDFFKDKINLAIMLAPVATVHNSTAKIL